MKRGRLSTRIAVIASSIWRVWLCALHSVTVKAKDTVQERNEHACKEEDEQESRTRNSGHEPWKQSQKDHAAEDRCPGSYENPAKHGSPYTSTLDLRNTWGRYTK